MFIGSCCQHPFIIKLPHADKRMGIYTIASCVEILENASIESI
ncbi:MAG: hypothetical protein OFPI_17060 [Osedax symbiont Rs2]|nr:MAG: hypothetical protein OFPI_17060 [Osedax symbiont Rs2]